MNSELSVLILTAASLGFIHTILGPDHYIPFIVMSKAGKWSKFKTILVTVLSGVGHVLSSVLLGFIGIAFGIGLNQLTNIESSRGELAGWLMITFGLIYFAWGIKKIYQKKIHTHFHTHKDGTTHSHSHAHNVDHSHVHEKDGLINLTPWIIFTIFVFGPCEVLIPLLMYPAAVQSIIGLVLVVLIFGLTTVLTMLTIVIIGTFGLNLIPFNKLEKYSHAIAGLFIFLAGASIKFLGL